MRLERNPSNYFAEIEQAAFAPSNLVRGIDVSPDKMLLARIFAYADAQRYRIGTNFAQLPVNAPRSPVNGYGKDGHMRHGFRGPEQPVYAPNSLGGPAADPALTAHSEGWRSDGEMTRVAATLHKDDDDFGQAGALYRDVMDDAAKARTVENIAGHVSQVKRPELLARVFEYWAKVDPGLGAAVKAAVEAAPKA
jgi:catalase